MKKVLILAAVAAIAATACNKTYEVNPTPGVPIGFGTWTEHLTKAHDPSNATAFENGESFNVYGYKTLSSGNVDVFQGTKVTLNNGTWEYTPTRFWDPTATSYTFFAVSPADLLDGVGASATTAGAFTSESITFDGKTDILVANKETVTDYSAAVPLKFNHIASLLDLKVKKVDNLEVTGEDENNYIKVAVTSISLSNIDAVGRFTVAAYDNTSFVPTTDASTWTLDTGEKKTYTHESGFGDVTLPNDVKTSTQGSDDLISKLVVMPQSFRTDGTADQTVTIEYTITTAENGNTTVTNYSKSFDLKEFDNSDDTGENDTLIASWMPNTHYIYTITIGANAITFSASIKGWATSTNGYHYLLQ